MAEWKKSNDDDDYDDKRNGKIFWKLQKGLKMETIGKMMRSGSSNSQKCIGKSERIHWAHIERERERQKVFHLL